MYVEERLLGALGMTSLTSSKGSNSCPA